MNPSHKTKGCEILLRNGPPTGQGIGPSHSVRVIDTKYQRLQQILRELGSCVVAYSGGVDSVFLAAVAHRVLGSQSLAVIADSPSLPRRELAEALAIAAQFQIPAEVVNTAEFADDRYLANPGNRCYFCKHALFTELVPRARAGGFACIVYGENASDVGDHRPGAQAATEFKVRAPLKEAGLTKAEIRELSASLGLPTADKPQMACLSSRIPTGERVTPEKLKMIEDAEYLLRDLGFYDVRVRHHELSTGHLARIEVGPSELGRFFSENHHATVADRFRTFGYLHTTIDLAGYRRGSTNGQPTPPASIPFRRAAVATGPVG